MTLSGSGVLPEGGELGRFKDAVDDLNQALGLDAKRPDALVLRAVMRRIDNKLTVPAISIAASPRQVVELAVNVHITCDGSVGQILGPQSTPYTPNQLVPA